MGGFITRSCGRIWPLHAGDEAGPGDRDMLYSGLATDAPVGRPGKLGEKPTRSRHCMRGACAVATTAVRLSVTVPEGAGRRDARVTIRESGHLSIRPTGPVSQPACRGLRAPRERVLKPPPQLLCRAAILSGPGNSVGARTHRLEVRCAGHAFSPSSRSSLLFIAPARAAFAQAASIQGRVLESADQARGGRRGQPAIRRPACCAQTPSRADGSFVLANVPPGSYDLGRVGRRFPRGIRPHRPGSGGDAERGCSPGPRGADRRGGRLGRVRRSGPVGGDSERHGRVAARHRGSPVHDGRRRAEARAGDDGGAFRRPRQRDVGVPARRRVRLHARDGRRRQAEQLRRRVRFRPSHHVRPQPDRGGARAAERRVRLRRHWRRRPDAIPDGRAPVGLRPAGNGVLRHKSHGGGLVGIAGNG